MSIRRAARGGEVARANRPGWLTSARERPAVRAALDAILADYTGWYCSTTHRHGTSIHPRRCGSSRLIPMLVVDGALDLDDNHEVAKVLATRIRDAQDVQLATAGHMANMEAPTEIDRALIELARRA